MATVFELPDELDMPAADQSQPGDSDVCDVLAGAGPAEDVEAEDEQPKAGTDADDAAPNDSSEQEPADSQSDSEGAAGPAGPASEVIAAELPADKPPAVVLWSPPGEMVNLVDCIVDAERECCESERLMEALKEELKEAKKDYETRVKRLRTFARELDRKAKPAKPVIPATPVATTDTFLEGIEGIVSDPEPAASSISDAVQDDLSWRSVPLTEIGINSIKGLGQKKIEALLDLCPTLGAFEDLRAKVGTAAASLPELMPKGIGQQACDALEEMVLDWIAKRQTKAVGEAFVEGMAKPVEPISSEENQIVVRAKELDNGEPNCLAAKQSDDTLWKGGWRSFEDSVAITECPWMPSENQDEWLRGWLAAKSVAAYEGKDQPGAQEPQEQQVEQEQQQPETEAVPFDIDSL